MPASKCTSSPPATWRSLSTGRIIAWRRAKRSTARTTINTARATPGCCFAQAAGRSEARRVGKGVGISDWSSDVCSSDLAFNLNLLERINRELGGDIAVENFTHRAVWNDTHARIEMHLVAACDMAFTVDGQDYRMAKGETIHSENSHKYGPRDARLLLRAGGWTPRATWDDADPAFALILAEATPFRSAP